MATPARRTIALLLCVLHLTGCSTWRSASSADVVQILARAAPRELRVTRRGGEEIELRNPTVSGDSIIDGRAAIAVSDIERVETKHFSAGKTLLLLVAIPVVTFGLLILSYSGYDHVAG
ncbi:MAG: hypothetical protein ABMA15_28765 [Vicinamibacterales bacterium]